MTRFPGDCCAQATQRNAQRFLQRSNRKAVSSDINGAFNYQPNGLASISLAILMLISCALRLRQPAHIAQLNSSTCAMRNIGDAQRSPAPALVMPLKNHMSPPIAGRYFFL